MAWTNYKDLIVWNKSMDLVKEVYSLINHFPKSEAFALSLQLQRSVVSVPSNIAEGRGRQTEKEFKQFLHIARGSLYEVETQLLIAVQQSYLTDSQIKSSLVLIEEIERMLSKLILSLDKK